MRYNQRSVAYKRDFDHRNINKNKSNLTLIKSNSVSILGVAPFQAIMLLLILIAIVSCLIYNKVVLDRIGCEIIKYQNSYEELLSEKARLEIDMESKVSLKNIEEIAKDQGLCQIQDYQIEYVDFQTKDNIKLIKNKENIFNKLKNIFNGLLAYIK